MSTHLDLATMRRLAARRGCRVVRVQRWASEVPDREGVGYELRCPDHDSKVSLLDDLAWWDAKRDMGLRQFALLLLRSLKGWGLTRPLQVAAAVQRLVSKGVLFQREPLEVFQDGYLTLMLGAGDCDDQARLVAALLRILGLKARLHVLRDKRRIPKHVAAQVRLGPRWYWLETTLAARFGEHPVAAKKRLRATQRADL